MPKLLLPISKGFEEIEAVTIIDLCRRAHIDVTIATLGEREVLGAHNIQILANTTLESVTIDEFDMIVLPGGGENTQNLAQSEKLRDFLQHMKSSNKLIGAICAAPYALHTAGVLNHNYTCYPSFEKKIREEGYSHHAVVQDGKVITSRGPGTAIGFALEVIELLCGEAKAEEVQKGILA